MLIYSIAAYLVGFASIVYWILSVSHLIPEISIDQEPRVPFLLALLNNLVLVALFGVQHSIMARPWFKDFFSSYFPRAIERSTFILVSGLLLFFLVIQWQPLGGLLWDVSSNITLNYFMYALFFIGWSILFISTFLINHLDFFGLRQVYFEIMKKPYKPLNFEVVGFYKYMRHPIYFGGMLGLWATPVMTGTHLVFAIFLSAYFIIGTFFEEKDLRKEFGNLYKHYVENTPMYVPFPKKSNTKKEYLKRVNKLKSKTMFWMLFTMFSIAATTAQTVAIPDSNFEQALIDAGQDSDGTINGLILQSDAEAVNTLALNNKGINSLQGIEGFVNVTSIVCSNNNLTSLNLSSNTALQTLDCSNNNLSSIDISNNTSLTYLIAINSQLTSLDISSNTLLTYLSVPFNQLTNLNVSNNTVLETMYVHSNELTSLDVSNLSLLQTLYCYSNDITNLNVSNATALEYLQCYSNLFTSLNVNTNINLKELRCSDGEILSIDVSNNILLEDFRVWGNQLASLDLSNNPALAVFSCANNNLTSLNLKNGNNTMLTSISTTNNSNLTCIDVDNVAYSNTNWTNIDAQTSFSEDCNASAPTIAIPDDNFETALIDLGIDTNGFTGDILQSEAEAVTNLNVNNKNISSLLGIEGFTNLSALQCENNNLTSLDVSNNLALAQLDCSHNQLTTLLLGNNMVMYELLADNNQLTVLNIENNTALSSILIGYNQITNMDASNNLQLFELSITNNQLTNLNVKNGNNVNIDGVYATNNPSLYCIEVDDVAYSNANWSAFIDPQTNFSEDCSVPFPTIAIPDVNFEQALIDLGYDNNGLTGNILQSEAEAVISLDVGNENISNATGIEGFINLIELRIGNNDIEDLEGINSLEDLEILICNNNDLTSLNISNNIALKELHAGGNAIGSLDVSNNILLESLTCSTCQLTNINVSNNPDLTYLELYENQLTTLDISNNLDLEELSFASNQITSMDLNNHTVLIEIYAANNQLTSFNVKNGNNTIITDFEADNNPNLYCIQVDNAPYSTALWSSYIDAQTSFDENCESLGVNEESIFDTVSLYPNPSSEVFYVKGLQEDSQIKIYDFNGRSILATTINNNQSVNVSQIPSGIYLVNIKNNLGETVKKLVVN